MFWGGVAVGVIGTITVLILSIGYIMSDKEESETNERTIR